MTNKIVKREGVIYITPDGKIASIKFSAVSDLHSDWDLPRGSLGGHIDVNDEPLKNKVRELKEDRGFIPRNS